MYLHTEPPVFLAPAAAVGQMGKMGPPMSRGCDSTETLGA